MRSHGQGLMATLMMFVPLLAVPFIATWGVPWLSAKVNSDGLADAKLNDGASPESGVGHSATRRHSADDLFAAVTDPPVVDLRFRGDDGLSNLPSEQNPHLRNASLVVTRDEGWVDPFDQINASPAAANAARMSVNPSHTAPQRAAEEQFGPGSFAESPPPRVFADEDTLNNHAPTPAKNPFAESAPDFSAREIEDSQVAVNSQAFADPNPAPQPRINNNRDSFNPSRTLFEPGQSPAAANEPAELAPAAPVQPNAPPEPLEPPAAESQPLTFESARAQLKSYGITHYYLQPDAAGEMYHFRCAFVPSDNSRVNRLFEAEAAEPLAAVQDVLDQLKTWTARESASAN